MNAKQEKEKIIIVDFGSQVTKLIARRVRELGVYSEILNLNDLKKLKIFDGIKGIILSGGPSTVTKKSFPNKNYIEIDHLQSGVRGRPCYPCYWEHRF